MKKVLIFSLLFVSQLSYAQSDTLIIDRNILESVQEILIEVQKTNKFLNNSDEITKLRNKNSQLSVKIKTFENTKVNKENTKLKKEKKVLVEDSQLLEDTVSLLKNQKNTHLTKINTLTNKIEKLENNISRINKDIENEKIFIREQIEFIIKQKSGTFSKEILVGLYNRSKKHQIEQNIISQFNDYIKFQNILVEAKEVLDVSFNSNNVQNKINNLDGTDFSSFKFLEIEMYFLFEILDNYQLKCKSLSQEFSDFVTYKMSNNDIINHIELIKNEYKEYPFLLKKIDEKVKSPNKIISVNYN